MWTKIYGGIGNEEASFLSVTQDKGYIISGRSNSWGQGFYDIYIIKTDSNGYSGCYEKNTSTITTNPPTTISTPTFNSYYTNTIIGATNTTIGNGAFVFDPCTTNNISMVHEEFLGLKIYPNPSTVRISVIGSNIFSFQNSTVLIQNTLGETIKQIPFTKDVCVSDLTEGCYFLQVILQSGETYTAKFMKQ